MPFSGLSSRLCVVVLVAASLQAQTSRPVTTNPPAPYDAWLNQDVRWIITNDEEVAFKHLSNDAERDNFIEAFWVRRDPTPDTVENEFRDEHYRRIAYANERFAAGKPGFQTERGSFYIRYGAPDAIEPCSAVDSTKQDRSDGSALTLPCQVWRYRYLEGVGPEVHLRLTKISPNGDYRLVDDPSELLTQQRFGSSVTYDALGLSNRVDRFRKPESVAGNVAPAQPSLRLIVEGARPPRVRFVDLEEIVTHKIKTNFVPFSVRTDSLRLTGFTSLVRITIDIQDGDLNFSEENGGEHGQVDIFGRLTTPGGQMAHTFEDSFPAAAPHGPQPEARENPFSRVVSVPLRRGQYHLSVAIKDVQADRVGAWYGDIVAQ